MSTNGRYYFSKFKNSRSRSFGKEKRNAFGIKKKYGKGLTLIIIYFLKMDRAQEIINYHQILVIIKISLVQQNQGEEAKKVKERRSDRIYGFYIRFIILKF